MKRRSSALVICSGGLDSTVMLYQAVRRYGRVAALTFTYGQNHARMENAAAGRICRKLGIPLKRIDLGFIGRHFSSSLLGGKVPDGDYNSENMRSTVVPFRNGIILAVAAGMADSGDYAHILLGNHGGDHFIYPDCRPGFIEAMKEAIRKGTTKKIKVESPFCNLSKSDIVRIGASLGVPFEMTYSCYKGGRRHCGKCGTCRERKEAFALAGIPDPTEYTK